jgi:hypothetical protein
MIAMLAIFLTKTTRPSLIPTPPGAIICNPIVVAREIMGYFVATTKHNYYVVQVFVKSG